MSYWAGASSVDGARNRGLIREPGTSWDYENYDTLLAVYAMKQALGDPRTYLEFPRKALLDRIGMRNTLLSTDRFGDFILSSQVYTNARDLAQTRPAVSAGRRMEWSARHLSRVDRLRANTCAGNGAAEQRVRRALVARAGQQERRT